MTRRWIRIDVGWDSSDWVAALDPAAQLAWVKLLCWVKVNGARGRTRALSPAVAAKRWDLPEQAVTAMLSAATMPKDGEDAPALALEGGDWVVTKWAEYQEPDPTAAERKRKERSRKQLAPVTPIVTETPKVTPGHAIVTRDTYRGGCDPSRDHRPPTETETLQQTATTGDSVAEADVEKSGDAHKQPTTEQAAPPSGAMTRREVFEAAENLLGLGRLTPAESAANSGILARWLQESPPRDLMEIWCAIQGAADMRDRDLVGWDSVKPGVPVTLRALNGAVTLAYQGDGRTQRTLYHAAYDHFVKLGTPPRAVRAKGNGMSHVRDLVTHAS